MSSSQGQYVRLGTVGRRTGKEHQVIVRYIASRDGVVVFPQSTGRQDWVANIAENPRVTLYTERGVFACEAHVREVEGLKDPLLGAFLRKYGYAEVRQKYWGQDRYVEIKIGGAARPLGTRDLVYGDLEAAFDGVAESYDEHIFGNPMNVWLRNVSVSVLSSLFRPGDTVLEIGCGTGTETLGLARRGIKVIATDVSGRMLEVLRRKAVAAGLAERIITLRSRPYELKEGLGKLGFRQVDGAYSTYGAMNTDPVLGALFEDLSSMIRPGGSLVVGVWNKYCLYEMVGYTFRARPSMILARLSNPVPVGRSRFCVSTYSYSVGEFDRIAGRSFRLRRVLGVGIFLPPSNLTRYLPPAPLLRLSKRLEMAISGRFPWNRLGDHFLAIYERPSLAGDAPSRSPEALATVSEK